MTRRCHPRPRASWGDGGRQRRGNVDSVVVVVVVVVAVVVVAAFVAYGLLPYDRHRVGSYWRHRRKMLGISATRMILRRFRTFDLRWSSLSQKQTEKERKKKKKRKKKSLSSSPTSLSAKRSASNIPLTRHFRLESRKRLQTEMRDHLQKMTRRKRKKKILPPNRRYSLPHLLRHSSKLCRRCKRVYRICIHPSARDDRSKRRVDDSSRGKARVAPVRRGEARATPGAPSRAPA